MNFLADTWWYGMTRRWDRRRFQSFADLRAQQGFDAVQIVVGIPPEVGPEHPEAASDVGPAWESSGRINHRYLSLARDRMRILSSAGLRPIVYGAWGPQIDWLGAAAMQAWWSRLIDELGDLHPLFCVAGEVDLHCDDPSALLPDLSSQEIQSPTGLRRALDGARRRASRGRSANARRLRRLERWRGVLEFVHATAEAPVLVHTTGSTTAFDLFGDHPSLAANSTQTGHDRASQSLLYERPLEHALRFGGRSFVNLEPWYEGIRGDFGTLDQLFAFWASRLGGSAGHAYGAQGVWNLGDGRFLAHWGGQTFDEASRLSSPEHLGRLHHWCRVRGLDEMAPYVRRDDRGRALAVGRRDAERLIELRLSPGADSPREDLETESSGRLDLFGHPTVSLDLPCLFVRGLDIV